MRPDDQYPSTSDAQANTTDDVLATLRNARARVNKDWTSNYYVGDNGAVCAVGAIFAAEGEDDAVRGAWSAVIAEIVEDTLRTAAREALTLVNEAAVDLFPRSANYKHWSGPIEYLNQINTNGRTRKSVILECYDHAIGKRASAST